MVRAFLTGELLLKEVPLQVDNPHPHTDTRLVRRLPSGNYLVCHERDGAVQYMISTVIEKAHAAGRKVGFCGQAPSNDPDFARLLVGYGIDSISVTPDSFIAVKRNVAEAERG